MGKLKEKLETADVLFEEYDWFKKLFPLALQKSSDGFFQPGLRCELVGVSRNINLMQGKEAYYVTKVKIDKFYDMFLRMSDTTVSLLLNKGMGRAGRPFDINKLTDLESRVLTGFNDYVSKIVTSFLDPPPVVNFVRTNFDITHLTFVIRDEEAQAAGRFIISVPNGRISPQKVQFTGDKFEFSDFYKCHTDAYIVIGRTRFTVKELKGLEPGDFVVLEDSNLQNLTLYIRDETKTILINPNMDLEVPFDEINGGNEMASDAEAKNLWDSIEVDMYAELNPVKISLGDLKKIEEGLVVDVAALYDNKVTLRVENKVIGYGELVIVNDRYGVKVQGINQEKDEDTAAGIQDPGQITGAQNAAPANQDELPAAEPAAPQAQAEAPAPAPGGAEDEEFDYSDFELEDEDI